MKIRLSFLLIFFLITNYIHAQQPVTSDYEKYIEKYKFISIREMELYKIPASITLAQGMLESGCGKSLLAVEAFNHFGIKCHKEWLGEKYYYDDDEINECFRKYNNVNESFRDHSIFLKTRPRYAFLFDLSITDYKGWASGLKQAGYATNPDYANLLIRMIENNKLYLFDDSFLVDPKDKELIVAQQSDVKSEKVRPLSKKGHLLFSRDYVMPISARFEYAYTSDMGRKVYLNNNVPFIFAQKGDTWHTLAKDFKIYSFQIYKQNDLLADDPITPGQILYLEPKKRKNSEQIYTVKLGDTIYSICQEMGVKLQSLLKYNKMKREDELTAGIVLKLRR